MVKAKKYVLLNEFKGVPKRGDFKIIEEDLSLLKDGEILVKTEWVSIDPYIRIYSALSQKSPPYDVVGYQVGAVLESKSVDYKVGDRVVSHKGWRDYTVIDVNKTASESSEKLYKLPDVQGLSPSLGVGILGMPGVTAYYGFLEICKPKSGETVVVTSAAGAVGSTVGQIAKIKGCRVIGIAGSDEKVAWLENELGFDKGINYKTDDVSKALKEAAPNGVDCYFDNVGGEISHTIMGQMNSNGRVSISGCISAYNLDPDQLPKATIFQPAVLMKQLKIEGFHANRWDQTQWEAAIKEISQWIKSNQLKTREHVTVGFDKLVDAFVDLFEGRGFGKAVVKV